MKTNHQFHFAPIPDNLRQALTRLMTDGVPPEAVQIYRGARNTLYELTIEGERLCVKHFRRAKFPNNFIYTNFRASKARRSFDHANRLLSMGFDTPQPIAYGENKRGLRLVDSYYICRYVDIANIRGWAERSDSAALIKALAAEMARLHDAGVLNKDFSPGNILAQPTADGRYLFFYVDLNRMRFDVRDRAKLMTMFRSISLDADDTRRLAEAYAEATGLDTEPVVDKALALLNHYHAVKRRHRFFKRLIHRGRK